MLSLVAMGVMGEKRRCLRKADARENHRHLRGGEARRMGELVGGSHRPVAGAAREHLGCRRMLDGYKNAAQPELRCAAKGGLRPGKST